MLGITRVLVVGVGSFSIVQDLLQAHLGLQPIFAIICNMIIIYNDSNPWLRHLFDVFFEYFVNCRFSKGSFFVIVYKNVECAEIFLTNNCQSDIIKIMVEYSALLRAFRRADLISNL